MKTFQLLSDVHLEHYNCRDFAAFLAKKDEGIRSMVHQYLRSEYNSIEDLKQIVSTLIIPSADYLVVAGDLTDFTTFAYASPLAQSSISPCYANILFYFFDHYCTKFRKIFYVLGNHEFYNSRHGLEGTVAVYRQRLRTLGMDNVVLLERDHVVLDDDLHVLGTTLWSEIDPYAAKFINDYAQIRMSEDRIAWTDTLAQYKGNAQWLKEQMDAIPENEKIVVITHHLPSYDLIDPIYHNSPVNSAFASDLNDLIARTNVKAWLFGHTHSSISRGKCHANPRGYPDKTTFENQSFSTTLVVPI